jgi:ribonuclease BN (tRNA processing enzyme)
VVLDLGNGALGPLQRLVRLDGIDAILLTHLHPDHCLDLCGLFVASRYNPEGSLGSPIPLFGPPGTLDRLEQAYGKDAEGQMGKVYDVTTWEDGASASIGPLAVTARRVSHPVDAFGLRLEHRGRALAYTGDTDVCPALDLLALDADVLLSEASFVEGRDLQRDIHMTGLRAGQVATAVGARRLVLTHIPVWTDRSVVLAEARSSYSGPVELARAGAVFHV